MTFGNLRDTAEVKNAVGPRRRTDGLRRSLLLSLVLALLVIVLSQTGTGVFSQARLTGFDLLQRSLPPPATLSPVVVVAIDDRSLEQVGQWPWPRDVLADLTTRIHDAGASVVGFDIVFAEADRSARAAGSAPPPWPPGDVGRGAPTDRAFAEALAGGPSVLGMADVQRQVQGPRPPLITAIAAAGVDPLAHLPASRALVRNIGALEQATAGIGVLSVSPHADGIARSLPLTISIDGQLIPHFALEVLRVHDAGRTLLVSGDDTAIRSIGPLGRPMRTGRDGAITIRFPAADTIPVVSAASILDGPAIDTALDTALAGRIVLVGSTATGVGDKHTTPLGGTVAGIEVAAAAVHSLASGTHLVVPPDSRVIEAALAAGLAVAVALLFHIVPGIGRLAIPVAAMGAAVAVSVFAFAQHQVLIDATLPGTAGLASGVALLALRYRRQERVAAESTDAVRRYDLLMSHIAENSFDGLLTTDETGMVQTANRAAASVFAATDTALADQPVRRLLPDLAQAATDPSTDGARLATLAEGRLPIETTGRRPDGTTFDADLAVTRLIEGGNRMFILVVRDVTARRQAERRLTDAIDGLQDGFALWDRDGRLCAYNDRCQSILTAVGGAVALGCTFEDAMAGVARNAQDGEAGQASRDLAEASLQVYRQSGAHEMPIGDDRWVLASHKRTSEGGTVSLYTDISLLKDREFQLIRSATRIEEQAADLVRFASMLDDARRTALIAAEEARAADSAKSAFLGMISHELRTPLNAINGFSTMIMDAMIGPIGQRYRDYGQAINESGRRLLTTINMILDLTKIESGALGAQVEDCDVAACLRADLKMLEPQARTAGVTLRSEVAPGLPTIRADSQLLTQIIVNIASNAIKFTPAGGAVTVTASSAQPGSLTIEVVDTGIGIAEADLERAMAPFGQIDTSLARRYEGTGLGLPIARKATEALGGTFTLTSEVEVGTRVTVWLPTRHDAHPPPEEPQAPGRPAD